MSQSCKPIDCADILRRNLVAESGIYTIYPQGEAQSVFCDMETDCGGWTVRTCVNVSFYPVLPSSIQCFSLNNGACDLERDEIGSVSPNQLKRTVLFPNPVNLLHQPNGTNCPWIYDCDQSLCSFRKTKKLIYSKRLFPAQPCPLNGLAFC